MFPVEWNEETFLIKPTSFSPTHLRDQSVSLLPFVEHLERSAKVPEEISTRAPLSYITRDKTEYIFLFFIFCFYEIYVDYDIMYSLELKYINLYKW